MANSVLQIIGLVLSLCAALCTLLAVVLPEWRRNDPKGEVIEAVVRHQGIWLRCVSYTTGLWQCDDFDTFFLGLPVQLQVARGLSLISLIAAFFAIMMSIVGMECTKCMESSERIKSRIALIAASFWMFSALAIGVAVSYFGHQVVQDYTVAEAIFADDAGQRYIFGSSIFLGWGAMGIGILGGAIMMCGSCYVENDADEYWNKGKVGNGVRRMRNSFRESFRVVRPRKPVRDEDYV